MACEVPADQAKAPELAEGSGERTGAPPPPPGGHEAGGLVRGGTRGRQQVLSGLLLDQSINGREWSPHHASAARAALSPNTRPPASQPQGGEVCSGAELPVLLLPGGDVPEEVAALLRRDGTPDLLDAGVEALPMALDRASPTPAAAASGGDAPPPLAVPAAAALSQGSLPPAPAAEALPPAAADAAARQESTLLPQCAVMTGAALEPPEVSTSHVEPLPAAEPSAQYLAVRADLAGAVIPPGGAGISWDAFPNHLGDGARARLLALATLHVGAGGGGAPAALRELPANSNKVLLGAANNCELYQERVVRWVLAPAGAGQCWPGLRLMT